MEYRIWTILREGTHKAHQATKMGTNSCCSSTPTHSESRKSLTFAFRKIFCPIILVLSNMSLPGPLAMHIAACGEIRLVISEYGERVALPGGCQTGGTEGFSQATAKLGTGLLHSR